MQADAIRWLFMYDRWATRRLLDAIADLDPEAWEEPDVVGERSLAQVMVHHLGASQRWRIGIASRGTEEGPRPEHESAPGIDELRARWETEWREVDAWLSTLSDEFVTAAFDGVPIWQMLVHVVNHGTQHRSESAAILSDRGRSPGDLDMIDYADERARADSPTS